MTLKISKAAIRACPECGSKMDDGHVRTKSGHPIDLFGIYDSVAECWFSSSDGQDSLVVPGADKKRAYRCDSCGTTIILRGR
jgi:DNA-directed RNA polymerase subunit RPC12/RpoP